MKKVMVIGAGLAGSEAAWQLAERGIPVQLIEMRPSKKSPAHHTDQFAELVCSNSLRAAGLTNAVGILKEEMRRLDSLIMKAADANRVPAGGALAVDRDGFSQYITQVLENHPLVEICRTEQLEIPKEGIVIVASGPLTSEALSESIKELTGDESLYFYDAAAPIVEADSINFDKVFRQSRYQKGDGDDYLNCPMYEDEYQKFYEALVGAELAPRKEFEPLKLFEGCMPVEELARRGKDTIRFGPLKPVGILDPATGKRPYAVVQLRQENLEGSLYNLVGFQTHLKWPEQKRVFRMIPGLENAEFSRYGVMHRNTFIESPRLLLATLQLRTDQRIFFAGQMTGVEGYIESAASGLAAGINAALLVQEKEPVVFPNEMAMGSLFNYITTFTGKSFQPMNATLGLFPPLDPPVRDKKLRASLLSERSFGILSQFRKYIDK
ncbi:MAG: methylenetetrahydrofolate--tRNA-(uracil(54)-C(5))-methyltransferase (FADH(2)-oxidizing) TrmFO [Negativicutes bacterium]|jgi:methylenetetrahydrofolate--tRNA-(uracil-5-)-methyltransferase|nr:methylenetetrahydrofolate--tRNA-(uracil(54)-C(5))-methyltransferase (FADH(2)-oxidizing) TrmFO [Negativicutes bacterium]